jgi:hypothetical protein
MRRALGKSVVAFSLILVIAVGATGYVLATTFRPASTLTSSENPDSLLSPDVVSDLAWNGAGRYVPGINQSAPPWNEPSIQAHITEGWQALCQTQAFVEAIQAHGARSFSAGGGFVNPNDVNASVAAIVLGWAQASGANCTQYQESWDIFIVNGTASAPTSTSAGPCISMAAESQ